MPQFIEQCCSTHKQAQPTTQTATRATRVEQLHMNESQGWAGAAHARVASPTAAATAVVVATAAQVPAAIPHTHDGMPRGNRPEGTPKYEGKQVKTWKPGCPRLETVPGDRGSDRPFREAYPAERRKPWPALAAGQHSLRTHNRASTMCLSRYET